MGVGLAGVENVAWALLVRPLVIFLLILFAFAPAVYAVKRWFPDGKMKRLLLTRVDK